MTCDDTWENNCLWIREAGNAYIVKEFSFELSFFCFGCYIYMHCIYMRAPPKIYLWCFSRDVHDETNCILQLIMQWVWSCIFFMPFKEAASLQHIEHSAKHAVVFSEEVQFPFRKLFSLRSIIQYFFQNTRFLLNMQCVINIEYCCENVQWLMLITAFLKRKDCS